MTQNNQIKTSLLVGHGIPNYKEITPSQINTHIPKLLTELNKEFVQLEQTINEQINVKKLLTWEDVMMPLHQLSERLRWSWGVVSHLNGVCNTPELREAHSAQQPEVVRFINRIGQSKIIHEAMCLIKKQSLKQLDEAQRRILESELISMNQRGVALDDLVKREFNKDSERLAEISTTFSNNVLDATKNWSLLLTKNWCQYFKPKARAPA